MYSFTDLPIRSFIVDTDMFQSPANWEIDKGEYMKDNSMGVRNYMQYIK